MEFMKDRINQWALICGLLVGTLYLLINWTPSGLLLPFREERFPRSKSAGGYKDELGKVLADASTGNNKTVIMTVVNKAYVEGDKSMLDLFLEGFWLGEGTRPLIRRLLIVATDGTSFDRCKFLGLHCYQLKTEDGLDGEKVYMSPGFLRMMWIRTQFLGNVLKRGYSFIFTDTDIMWLRDPFPRLNQNRGVDFQISVDVFNGDPWSQGNPMNTGFYMVRSNNRSIAIFDAWYARRNASSGIKEQDVLRQIRKEGMFRRLGFGVRYLETVYFSGFCESSRDVGAVITVHANCCRTIAAKVADLTAVLHDWKRFARSPSSTSTNGTSAFRWSKHVACRRSWH
ncbi:uncharacterized protein At1g28695-like [Rhodamnia argentea]|uniref:Uncharacterized protein At1g28695-like n=1 Tax=Rhodamnia argentea TaxID=178133 RepID=A0A8B8PGB5_9MYRT|nr:uncharacterized protein At1g28695-like [Rhodamnia argentea]